MKKLIAIAVFSCFFTALRAQFLIDKGWKFSIGDDAQWASPSFKDDDWKLIEVGRSWEEQGYPNYDGYGWYRLHVVIPMRLKAESFLKGDVRIDLGKIDDGDEVYLNGQLIGQNAGKTKHIEAGSYDAHRIYTLPFNSPLIYWDKDNVLAVRVYDRDGAGGMYEGHYSIRVSEVTDAAYIDHDSYSFRFYDQNRVKKNILLKATNTNYIFSGELLITVQDGADNSVVSRQTVQVNHFTSDAPFRYVFEAKLPSQKSYKVTYVFVEKQSHKEVSVSEGIPYILTPKPGKAPRINGSAVAGVRPEHPFLFKIPATGSEPMTYAAAGLPNGLVLDHKTGVITGRVAKEGSYKVVLTVTNAVGKVTRNLQVEVGDRILLTPAMGWNSWNCWGLSVSDEKVKAAAAAMKHSGLMDHGWTYINMDDGWERAARASNGEIVPNDKFPDMKKMCDAVHGMGLKVGIYSSPGTRTCGGYLGSYQHELQDAQVYARWGIDYLKYDWCSYGELYPRPTLDEMKKPYQVMQEALAKESRDIVFSLCQYGMGDVWKWGHEVGGNSWRTTGDITDTWASMSGIGFHQAAAAPFAQPGNWNDPDMLVVGKVGWGPSLHNTRLTPDEQYTHISLWSLLSAPLLIGCDMNQLDDFTLNLLTNDEVLAIDQDALGKQAILVVSGAGGNVQVWEKTLVDGSKAIGLFNLSLQGVDALLVFDDIHVTGRQQLQDCWRQKELGTFDKQYLVKGIPAHGVVLLKVKPVQ